MKSARKLPAFGRDLMEMRRRGLVPERTILVCLDSWNWGRSPAWFRLVIDRHDDIEALDFSGVAGLSVIVAWMRVTRTERRDALIRAILKCNPVYLRVVDMSGHLGGDPANDDSFTVKSSRGLERAEFA